MITLKRPEPVQTLLIGSGNDPERELRRLIREFEAQYGRTFSWLHFRRDHNGQCIAIEIS